MKSIVIAITGASAMQIGERSVQLLLENNNKLAFWFNNSFSILVLELPVRFFLLFIWFWKFTVILNDNRKRVFISLNKTLNQIF